MNLIQFWESKYIVILYCLLNVLVSRLEFETNIHWIFSTWPSPKVNPSLSKNINEWMSEWVNEWIADCKVGVSYYAKHAGTGKILNGIKIITKFKIIEILNPFNKIKL